jgi:hypothetical protein
MENGQNAPRRRRKPASPRTRTATRPRQAGRTPPDQQASVPADDGSTVRARELAGRSPDVIWPETGPEAALELLRQWDAEDEAMGPSEGADALMEALRKNRQPPDDRVPLPETNFAAARARLQQWLAEEPSEEERQNWEHFERAIDEDRLSYRPLFEHE